MKSLFAALLFSISTLAAGEECAWNCKAPWTKTDIALQSAVVTFQVADWAQTRWFVKHPYYLGPNTRTYEGWNPILGENPSVGKVNNLIFLGIIGHAVVSNYLPPDFRRIWQGSVLVLEIGAVNHNRVAGVKFSW